MTVALIRSMETPTRGLMFIAFARDITEIDTSLMKFIFQHPCCEIVRMYDTRTCVRCDDISRNVFFLLIGSEWNRDQKASQAQASRLGFGRLNFISLD